MKNLLEVLRTWADIVAMQVYLHKTGASLLGKLTICIDNAGPLQDTAL